MRALVFSLAIVCLAGMPQEHTLQDHLDDLVASIQADDGSGKSAMGRGKASAEILAAHQRLVDQLIEIASTEKAAYAFSREPRSEAVKLLGHIGGRKAVPVLVKYVDWKYSEGVAFGGIHPAENYPCAYALIGNCATVPEIFKRLQAEPAPSEKAMELYAWLVVSPYGFGREHEAIKAVEARAKREINNKNLLVLLEKMQQVELEPPLD
ncbi:MAG: hypothetical protein WD847_15090 [Pirellulales bacterium]